MVEGLRVVENKTLDKFANFTIKAIQELAEGELQSHFAFKLTAYVSTEIMEKLNKAQNAFTQQILEISIDASN